MDRLGLLGEDLVPKLDRKPDLKWLADEDGVRVGIMVELGRIRDPAAFEEAVGWVLRNRPHTDKVRAEIRRLRARTGVLPGAASRWCPAAESIEPSLSTRRPEGPDLGGFRA